MNAKQITLIIWAWRKLILSCVMIFAIAGCVLAFALPTKYQATSRVMLDVVKPDPVTGEVINSQFAKAYAQSQVELIQDLEFAQEVVKRLGWTASSAGADNPEDLESRQLARQLISNMSVQLIEKSNILEITYTAPAPEAAADIANTIRATYLDEALASKRESAGRTSEWLRTQVDDLGERLAAAERRKSDFERENGIVLSNDSQDTEAARLAALASAAPTVLPQVSTAVSGGAAEAQLATLDAQIATALETLGPNHPDLLALRNQRDALRAAVAQQRAAGRQAQTTTNPADQVAALYSAQRAKVLANRGKVAEARRLAADVAVLTTRYNEAAARAGQLEQQAQSTDAGLSPLGMAVAPQAPVSPNRPLIILASVLAGLIMGFATAMAVELLNRRVRCSDDLGGLGVPVLGAMPSSNSLAI